ncbi:uncharacterized protein METZ01_LOCUS406804, partial [marine metagenome]
TSASADSGCGSYTWNGVTYNTTGTYTQTFTNVIGCDSVHILNVTIFPYPSFTINSGPVYNTVSCDGYAIITPSSGSAPYTYQWDTSGISFSNNDSAMNLCPGWYVYTVTATSGGCSITDSIEIVFVPCNLELTLDSAISCYGGSAILQAVVVGAATGPYTFELYSLPNQLLQILSNTPNDTIYFFGVTANTFFVTVTDSTYGLCSVDTLVVTQPDSIIFYSTIDSTSNPWTCDGNIVFDSITGGTAPYNYQWFDDNGNLISTNPSIDSLCFGCYALYIT